MRFAVIFSVMLAASVAAAQGSDAPTAASEATPPTDLTAQTAPSDAPIAPPTNTGVTLKTYEKAPPGWGVQFGVGAVAGSIGGVGSLVLGQWVGSLSNNLIGAAVPVLLCFGVIPPLLTTLATFIVGNWNEAGTFRFWTPLLVTAVINIVAMVVAGFAGVGVTNLASVFIFGIVDGIVLSAASTATMRLFPLKEAPKVAVWQQRDPVAPTVWAVKLSEVKF